MLIASGPNNDVEPLKGLIKTVPGGKDLPSRGDGITPLLTTFSFPYLFSAETSINLLIRIRKYQTIALFAACGIRMLLSNILL